jgi:hypothetical protein
VSQIKSKGSPGTTYHEVSLKEIQEDMNLKWLKAIYISIRQFSENFKRELVNHRALIFPRPLALNFITHINSLNPSSPSLSFPY